MSQPYSRSLRPAEAAKKLGIGVSTLYAKIKNDATFPRPIKIGPRTSVFTESSLDAWLSARALSTEA